LKNYNPVYSFLIKTTYKAFLFTQFSLGRTIAEAVSRWLPASAARVRARVWQVGFVVVKMASGTGFRFPLPKPFIPPTSPSSSQFKNIREK
jgi:hypothetical protein